ncbi:TIGR04104 family putative zinc finger protein [Lysinibacillus sp. NPDC093210]|uniref:TIGR04104 family putative zinc finger protein n=1 Tax=Lysinibacillus sp. NPDC093210 TaxID=3364133 RepID=UPI00380A9E60
MNQFKENVLHELQHVKLSEEKKQRIAQKVRAKSKHRSSSQLQYRIVLATFTLLAIGFSVLVSPKTEPRTRPLQGAALQQETERWSLWTLLELDWVKGLLLISIFVSIALIIKRILHKKGYGLPVCIECGEIWTAKQVRKLYWKNGQMECPHCRKKQYRTKKSVQLSAILNLPIPFIVFLNQAFDHFFIGIVFFIASSVIYHYLLLPDIVKLQEEDPTNEPLW